MNDFKSKKAISISKIEKTSDGNVVFTFSDNFATRKNYDFLECNQVGSHVNLFSGLSKEYTEAARFGIGERFRDELTEIEFCDILYDLYRYSHLEYFIKSIDIALLHDISSHANVDKLVQELKNMSDKFCFNLNIYTSDEPGTYAIQVEASSMVEEIEASLSNVITDAYLKMQRS